MGCGHPAVCKRSAVAASQWVQPREAALLVGVWLARLFVSKAPKGRCSCSHFCQHTIWPFQLVPGCSAPLTLYIKCCKCMYTHIHTAAESFLWNQLFHSRLALFPWKGWIVSLYLQCNKIQRQAVQKEKPVLALGIGGEMLWRRTASLAVLIGLKDVPRRPCFPLLASMWSTWRIWCRFVEVETRGGCGWVYIAHHSHTSSFAYQVWAAVGFMIVHVSASEWVCGCVGVCVCVCVCVCDEARHSRKQSNHTQMNSPVAHGSRGYMCLMMKGRCVYTQWMINYWCTQLHSITLVTSK